MGVLTLYQDVDDPLFNTIAVPAVGADPRNTWRGARQNMRSIFIGSRSRVFFYEFPTKQTDRAPFQRIILSEEAKEDARRAQERAKRAEDEDTKKQKALFDYTADEAKAIAAKHNENLHASTSRSEHLQSQSKERRSSGPFIEGLIDDFLYTIYEYKSKLEGMPLHFAAHSTGGTLLKASLLAADDCTDDFLGALRSTCFYFTFFGVPVDSNAYVADQARDFQDVMALSTPMDEALRDFFRSYDGADLALHTESIIAEHAALFAERQGPFRNYTRVTEIWETLGLPIRSCPYNAFEDLPEDDHFGKPSSIFLKSGHADLPQEFHKLCGNEYTWFLMSISRTARSCSRYKDLDVGISYLWSVEKGTNFVNTTMGALLRSGPRKFFDDLRLQSLRAARAYESSSEEMYGELIEEGGDRPKFLCAILPAAHLTWAQYLLRATLDSQWDLYAPWRTNEFRGLIKRLREEVKHLDQLSEIQDHAIPSSCISLVPRQLLTAMNDLAPSRIFNQLLPSSNGEMQLVIHMPYIHFDDYGSILERQNMMQAFEVTGSGAQPQASARCRRLSPFELDHLWNDVDGSHQVRQTLHQYAELARHDLANAKPTELQYKQWLHQYVASTRSRDTDQVQYKSWLRKMEAVTKAFDQPRELNAESVKLLVVDQLWCWVVDKNFILACCGTKRGIEAHSQMPKMDGALTDLYKEFEKADPKRIAKCESPFDLAAYMILMVVTNLIRIPQSSTLDFMQSYGQYIKDISAQYNESLQDFRLHCRAATRAAISQAEKSEPVNISQDLDNFLDLQDLVAELDIVKNLYTEQESVINTFLKRDDEISRLANQDSAGKSIGLEWLTEAELCLRKSMKRIEDYMTRCESLQLSYKTLLDLKQRQANIDEAIQSRESAEQAASQGRTIMTFTVFTIIFLPLSFLSSLFGMNVREWSGEPTNLSLRLIMILIFPVSCFVTIVTLLVAFNKDVHRLVINIVRPLIDYLPGRRSSQGPVRTRMPFAWANRPQRGDLEAGAIAENREVGKEKAS